MKTVTLSTDQAIAVLLALGNRIKALEADLAAGFANPDLGMEKYCRDQLEVARQALAVVQFGG